MRTDETPAAVLDWPSEGIARIALARGAAMNTLTWELMDDFVAALDAVASKAPRGLVITGQAKVFCGGAYLKYFAGPDAPLADDPLAVRDRYVRRIVDVFVHIRDMPCPVIAAINGHALGGGMELSLACDFRLMSTEARMGQPEVRYGLTPGGSGIQQLYRLVGRPKALEIMLLGEPMDAEAALACGLVNAIHPPEDLDAAALALAERFLRCGPLAVAATKRAVYRTETASPEEADRIALDSVYEAFSTAESREGIAAFVEKRQPTFAKHGRT